MLTSFSSSSIFKRFLAYVFLVLISINSPWLFLFEALVSGTFVGIAMGSALDQFLNKSSSFDIHGGKPVSNQVSTPSFASVVHLPDFFTDALEFLSHPLPWLLLVAFLLGEFDYMGVSNSYLIYGINLKG